jgi:glycosyltransferase involved in cell wall biosynthesis
MYWSCKGLETIHRVYEKLVKINFLFGLEIAGSGPQELKLINGLNKISNKHYKWNGWINNIDNFFDKIDVLIVPSLYDSSPNLIFEALQKNKIIFASDISAHREILKKEELLFSKNNLKSLIKRIMRIKNSRAYKKKLEKKIFELKKNHTFDWEKKFSKFVKKC